VKDELVTFVVLDNAGDRLGVVDPDVSLTLIALASEDPTDWNELLDCWPRYSSRAVPEFPSSLPFEVVTRNDAMAAIRNTGQWVMLDLTQKRYLSGIEAQRIERTACFSMHTDEDGKQRDPLSVHLAPWWEIHEQLQQDSLEIIEGLRQSPPRIPPCNREFLFGDPLAEYLAMRTLAIAETPRGRKALSPGSNRRELDDLTIEVHRDWLMSPREELGGMFPRQHLHGGVDWIDRLTWSQRLRFERGGQIVAIAKDFSGYHYGPMGCEEVVMYFDLCRELIHASWMWCQRNALQVSEISSESLACFEGEEMLGATPVGSTVNDLIQFLEEVKTEWLTSPFEGGSPPAFILECSRRRVPRGAGVEIVGMSERQSEQHVVDCDCPICRMMADGFFGPGFTSIDGHHLELDEEFAFSLFETLEHWQAEQDEYAAFSAALEAKERLRQQRVADGDLDEQDEFASVWSGGSLTGGATESDISIPGDHDGNLHLAFLLSEIISELQKPLADSVSDAGKPDFRQQRLIERLNTDFEEFRQSDPSTKSVATDTLSSTLEEVASHHPQLVSRVADFQSRMHEQLRRPT
jgi:hypothetical protein